MEDLTSGINDTDEVEVVEQPSTSTVSGERTSNQSDNTRRKAAVATGRYRKADKLMS